MSNVRKLSEACLAALFEHHTKQCLQNGIDTNTTDTDPFSGPKIAADFAIQAATRLSQDRLSRLLEFLKSPRPRQAASERELLKETLNTKLEDFYSNETRLSFRNRDRLTRPGGPEDANLGIIMHLQTKQGPIDKFWDQESATIALLQDKGLNGDFAFGYDWHWRAEFSFKSRRNCPVREWPPSLVKLHNEHSAGILDFLPLPFVITASACVAKNLKKTLGKDAVSLELIPEQGSDKLVLDLDFRDDRLHRMIIHVHHPTSGFFNTMNRRPKMAAQLDAGLNFFLWLTGRHYTAMNFRHAYSRRGRSDQAPLADLWNYVKRESDEQRILRLEEYAPSFVIWAGRYIEEDPYAIASKDISLATTVATKLRQNLSVAASNREQKKRKREEEARWSYLRGPHTSNDRSNGTLFHGKTVEVTPSGYVKLMMDLESPFVTFRISIDGVEHMLSSGARPIILFSPTHLTLCLGEETIYKTPNEHLIQSPDGLLWFDLISHELKAITGPLEQLPQKSNLIPSKTGPLAGGDWKSIDLQRRLLHGDKFHCGAMKNETAMGRIFFRDVAIFIPEHADFDTIYVQCFLAPGGSRHPKACVEACAMKNPANRLAIAVRFKSITTGGEEEMWATLRGKKELMKANSLVDFLEGKPEEYTEKQPLRFLPRSATRGRKTVCYTPDF